MAQVPYEFLVRWNHETGALKGAHVKIYDSVTLKEGDAQAVSVAGATGFPLGDVLTAIETGALLSAEQANTAKITAESVLAAEQAAHAETAAALAARIAQNADLEAQNAELTAQLAARVA